MILGHAHPSVVEAVRARPTRGFSFGTPTENEVALAEEIVAASTPVEQVRLVNSGTEATMTRDPAGPRLHRPQHGREVRRLLPRPRRLAARRGGLRASRPSGCPDTAGRHRRVRPPTRSCCPTTTSPPSRRPSPRTATRSPASSPRPPPATWASSRRRRVQRGAAPSSAATHGALLICDEVMTGFRVSPPAGTASRAVAAPDLFTFGKVMGGGFPAAAFGGRADVMAALAPAGPGLPGGHAVREPGRHRRRARDAARLHAEVYAHLDAVAGAIAELARRRRSTRGGPARRAARRANVQRLLPRRRRCATTTTPGAQDAEAFAAFFHAMLGQGVHLPPSAFEAWFVCAAHDDEAVDQSRTRCPDAAGAAAARFATSDPSEPPGTVVHLMRHGEVHNPEGDPLRPAARVPAVRARPRDGRAVAAAPSRCATWSAWSPPRWSGPRRPRVPIAATFDLTSRPTTGSSRPELLRGQDVRRRRRRPAPAGALAAPAQPVHAVAGASPRARSPPDARRDRGRARRRRGHEAVLVSHQLPIWTARQLEGRRLWHDPRKRECSLASLTSFTYAGDDLASITYTEPAAELLARAAKKAGA